jgi:hypothetical protein
MINGGFCNVWLLNFLRQLGGNMFEALSAINWEVIFQLVFIGLIVISGPIVIFLLAFRNGNL